MHKKFVIPYLAIFFTLLFLMSLSRPITEKVRGGIVALFAPLWESLIEMKQFIYHSKSTDSKFEETRGPSLSPQEEIQKLQLENQLLTNELAHLNSLLTDKQFLNAQFKENIPYKIQTIPARVIFRSFDSWYYLLWINVGEIDNDFYGMKIVAKNSPVLVGDSVVGIIDHVGRHQSRVRLITDAGLTPSVRAIRGGEQEGLIAEHIEFLLQTLGRKKSLSLAPADQETLTKLLTTIKLTLQPTKKTWYLAKGELRGSRTPLGRSHSQVLHGTGFNYDFPDEEGEERDLRTGKLLHDPNSTPIALLKVQDILVTTGMDGVFPAGLKIATVSKIDLLKEGDYFYELEANPTAGNLDELSLVFVIAPLGYDKNDQ